MDFLLRINTPADLERMDPEDYQELRDIATTEPALLVDRANRLMRAADRAIARGRVNDAREYAIDALEALREAERVVNDTLARGFPTAWFLEVAQAAYAAHRRVAKLYRRLKLPRRRVVQ